MLNTFRFCLILLLVVTFSENLQAQQCSDIAATSSTQKLYKNLFQLKDSYTIFGHQDAMAYGVGWRGIAGKSDIHDVVQDYPGLYGFDIANIELGLSKNIDGVPFNDIRSNIVAAHAKGSLVSISWHVGNPLTGKNAWDTTHGSVASVLPGGQQHQKYKSWLDKVAIFLQSLQTPGGEPIPVLFRPFHELTGTWFWWGKNNCTPQQFITLWNFTQDYLMQVKNVHHLIYVYNTADFDDEASFLLRYPGDHKIDILSFDRYHYEGSDGRTSFLRVMNQQLSILTKVASAKQKIAAIAETGYEAIPDPQWWTGTLYPLLQQYPVSHVLVWRNAGFMKSTQKMHYYAPYLGQVSASDFKQFYTYPKMLFEKQLATKSIYQQYYLPTHEAIRYMGRIDFSNPIRPSFWQPGVSIEWAFSGDSCGVIMEDEIKWGSNHNYIALVVDGVPKRIKLSKRIDTIWVKPTTKALWHQMVMCKNTEANIGALTFVGIVANKIQAPATKYTLKIECIGNSITCGTGSDVTEIPCGKGVWYDQHNAYMSYGMQLGRKLNAQVHLTSVSGIGLMHSCCNLPVTMPAVFDKINMSENKLHWDFKNYQPDVVTICLGQNDGVQDSAVFVNKYLHFLKDLRSRYPAANFICLSSPMADNTLKAFMIKTIQSVVAVAKAGGNNKVSSYFFQKQYHAGCDGHPSLAEHEEIAGELVQYLSTAILL